MKTSLDLATTLNLPVQSGASNFQSAALQFKHKKIYAFVEYASTFMAFSISVPQHNYM